ncbi:hypothetical protein [Aliarcobacter butzleri]|uniref:hypothetical protein n=1 Tax=Aliarcobacter butzleri TaxID=28197 RepID=UPI00214BC966|nr:hypothetical protein [Aliarcobacter butzleri]MCP3649048.1 hypothetical protein [Arcobacter sp. DNRA7]MCR1815222.1 hypothetical protein [Aliarcobacter butzleri]
MKSSITYLFVLLFLSSCSNNLPSNQNGLSTDTKNAIALCSSNFSEEQRSFLEASYMVKEAEISMGKKNQSNGLQIDQTNMDSKDKVELMKLYIDCIESHTSKKKL